MRDRIFLQLLFSLFVVNIMLEVIYFKFILWQQLALQEKALLSDSLIFHKDAFGVLLIVDLVTNEKGKIILSVNHSSEVWLSIFSKLESLVDNSLVK